MEITTSDEFKAFEALGKNEKARLTGAIELSVNVVRTTAQTKEIMNRIGKVAGLQPASTEAALSKLILHNWDSKLGDEPTEAELLEQTLPKQKEGKKLGGLVIDDSRYLIFSPEKLEGIDTYALDQNQLKTIFLKCGGDTAKAEILFPQPIAS